MQLITGRVTDFNYHTRVEAVRRDVAQLLPACRLFWSGFDAFYDVFVCVYVIVAAWAHAARPETTVTNSLLGPGPKSIDCGQTRSAGQDKSSLH